MFYYNYIYPLLGVWSMSKVIGEPITVHRLRDSRITAFIWRKRLYKVEQVLSWWREPAEWWNGKPMRLFVRVNVRNSTTGTYELYQHREEWFLARVLD